MSDSTKPSGELTRKAAFAAVQDAAERALTDALSTEEERAGRKAADVERARRRRTKWLVLGVVGLLIVLGLIGLALRYWYWFLLLGLVGLAALYGRYRWRKYRASRRDRLTVAAPRELPERRNAAVATPEPTASSVDEELAELKARVKS